MPFQDFTTYGPSAVPMLSSVVLDPDAPAAWGRSCADSMHAARAPIVVDDLLMN